jgi:glycosyltransferase involved in cell wall biosynthesis
MLLLFLSHLDRDRLAPAAIFFEAGPFEREVAALGIETHVVDTGRLRHPTSFCRATAEITSTFRRWKPDLVLNWNAKAQIYGGSAALAAGIGDRVVWWQHGVPERSMMDRLATGLPARAVGCSSAAVARAQALKRPGRRTFVVHPGVELTEAPPGPPPVSIPPGRVTIGIVGRLQPWKGQHRVIRALALLRDRGLDVHGLVVGGEAHGFSAGFGAELERLVDELELSDRVTMTGHVANAAAYMAAMDVFVSASDNEPFGMVLLEAMAQSLPVVAVAEGGPVEIVAPGRSGILLESKEPNALADALEPLILSPALRRGLGREGRELVEERFTAARMADELQSRLARIMRREVEPLVANAA